MFVLRKKELSNLQSFKIKRPYEIACFSLKNFERIYEIAKSKSPSKFYRKIYKSLQGIDENMLRNGFVP